VRVTGIELSGPMIEQLREADLDALARDLDAASAGNVPL